MHSVPGQGEVLPGVAAKGPDRLSSVAEEPVVPVVAAAAAADFGEGADELVAGDPLDQHLRPLLLGVRGY